MDLREKAKQIVYRWEDLNTPIPTSLIKPDVVEMAEAYLEVLGALEHEIELRLRNI